MKHDDIADHCIRVFHLAHEKRKMMCERIRYMIQNQYIEHGSNYVNEYIDIQKEILRCQYIILKYSLTKRKELLDLILKKMDKVKEIENKCLDKMIRDIIC